MGFYIFVLAVIFLIINISLLFKFMNLCEDVRKISRRLDEITRDRGADTPIAPTASNG